MKWNSLMSTITSSAHQLIGKLLATCLAVWNSFFGQKKEKRQKIKMSKMNLGISLKIPFDQASRLIEGIDDPYCQQGRKNYWMPDDNTGVAAHSILWFYCWAKTGKGNNEIAEEAQNIFDEIFDCSYRDFDKMICHKTVTKKHLRYSKRKAETYLRSMKAKSDAKIHVSLFFGGI